MTKNIRIILVLGIGLSMIVGCETSSYPEQFAPRVILDSYLTIGDTVEVTLTHSQSILTPYDSVAATISDARVIVTANGLPDTLAYRVESILNIKITHGDTAHDTITYRHYKSRTQIVRPNVEYSVVAYLPDGKHVYGNTHSPDVIHLLYDTTTTHDNDTISFGHGYGRPMFIKWTGDTLVGTYWIVAECHDTLQTRLRQEPRIGGRSSNPNEGGHRYEYWVQPMDSGSVPWFFFDVEGWYTVKVYNINDEFKQYLFTLSHNLDNVSQIQMNVVGGLGMVTAYSVDSLRVFVKP